MWIHWEVLWQLVKDNDEPEMKETAICLKVCSMIPMDWNLAHHKEAPNTNRFLSQAQLQKEAPNTVGFFFRQFFK